MAETPILPVLSLCTGGGGLDLGIELAFRGARALLYAEREVTAVQILATRVAQGKLAPAHLWSRVDTIPGVMLGQLAQLARERAVLASAGFPCQPWSRAGKRRGAADKRHLWPAIDRFLRAVRPGLIVLECVSAVTDGLDEVVGTLAALDYSARAACFEAWEAGAPHKSRDRWFCVGVADLDHDRRERDAERYRESIAWLERASRYDPRRCAEGVARELGDPHDVVPPAERREPSVRPADGGSGVGNADGDGWQQGADRVREGQPESRDAGRGLVDAIGDHPHGDRGREHDARGSAPRRPPLPRFPPLPGDRAGWEWVAEHYPELWPAAPNSGLRVLVDGLAAVGRPALITCAGNGVIPEQAALAIGELARELLKELR